MHTLKLVAGLLAFLLLSGSLEAAEMPPMKDGLHQWPALEGKLMLVVGTYQDTVHFRRSYSFYFKEGKNEAWNQVAVIRKSGERAFPWESAVGADVTLADGIVVSRPGGLYFVVGDKRVDKRYHDKGDIAVTWNKLTVTGDDDPDASPYRLAPVFTRAYPKSTLTVEAVLAREAKLNPVR